MKRLRWLAFLAAPGLLAVTAAGQGTAPPRRAHHAMAYDAAGKPVIMTGGSTPVDSGRRFTSFNDTWAFDGLRWTPLGESGEQMSGAGLAFDTRRNRLHSFGGFSSANQSLGDLRQLEGNAWRMLGAHPSVKAVEPGVVFDARRNRLATFGGTAGRNLTKRETWEFDGAAWSKLEGASPPARSAFAMAYDERRGLTVVFGGVGVAPPGQRPTPLADTWEYDGHTWAERKVAGPPGRFSPGVAYDIRRGEVIVFGGLGAEGFLGDTWAWNGTAWRKLSEAGPEPRAMGYFAYDPARDRIVLFGGRKGWPDGDLGDTREWDGDAWKRVVQP